MAKSKKDKTKEGRDEKGRFITGNQISAGHGFGRPPDYSDPEELAAVCADYFEYVKGEWIDHKRIREGENFEEISWIEREWIREPEPLTITGLALHLGFDSRSTLYEYAKKADFSHIIKKAMLKVEQGYEKKLERDKPTGAIFALKNMDWKDRHEYAPVTPDGEYAPTVMEIVIVPPPQESAG